MKTKFEGLKARREELNLTLEDLAKLVNISPAYVRSIELGHQKGRLAIRSRIADALKVPLRYLLSDAEAKEILGLSKELEEK